MLSLCNDNQTLLSPAKPSNRLTSPLPASLHTRAGAFKGATMKHGNTFKDLTGKRFGRLLVKSELGRDNQGAATWRCICDCGIITVVRGYLMTAGHTTSCGCYHEERRKITNIKHGATLNGFKTREYVAWCSMKSRCNSKGNKFFKHYGGRGIMVCRRWNKFENFLEDMGQAPTPKHTIDRKDNDGNYCKRNCRWSTHAEQQQNRQDTHWVTHNGKTKNLMQWSKELGFNYNTLKLRISKWGVKKAFETPLNLPCAYASGLHPEIARMNDGHDKNGHQKWKYFIITPEQAHAGFDAAYADYYKNKPQDDL
jgi:hypothetical protein